MLESYLDIRERIPNPPKWWDENGVPRYWPFAPGLAANIYADEVVALLIACQSCGTQFDVAMSRHADWDAITGRPTRSLADRIRDGSLHYGDPPNVGCCAAGATMNCDDLDVLEYWHRPRLNWERDTSLEIKLSEAAAINEPD